MIEINDFMDRIFNAVFRKYKGTRVIIPLYYRMKELMLSVDALIGKGLHRSVGLISDARFSGFNFGCVIGHVAPEAYDGGVIALIENGDEIEIDINNGTVNLLVPDEVLAERRKSWVQPPLKEGKGCLNMYARMCRPAEEGGAMQPWDIDGKYSDL